MTNARSQDNFVAYIAAAVVVSLVVIFVFTWNQIRTRNIAKPDIVFAQFGPYQIENQTFSISASLAVQTGLDEAGWAKDNREALNVIFKKVLADTDIKTIQSPNGLQILQQALTNSCNATFNTHYVQAVLLTDFVFQMRDS